MPLRLSNTSGDCLPNPRKTLHAPRAKLANVRFAQANGATLNTMLTMANMPSSHSKPAVINVAEIG